MCWVYLNLEPPDIVAHDAGKYFIGTAFQADSDMLCIQTKSMPVESAKSMTVVDGSIPNSSGL